jgi:hypothetical protein
VSWRAGDEGRIILSRRHGGSIASLMGVCVMVGDDVGEEEDKQRGKGGQGEHA